MEQTPSSSPRWLCVRTQPKREHIAAGQLDLLEGVDVFSPRIRFKRRTPRGKVWFEESLFPGYIFARFDLPMLRAVSSAVGVRGLVRFAGEEGFECSVDEMGQAVDEMTAVSDELADEQLEAVSGGTSVETVSSKIDVL
jgi:transcriptional antiterminator RfaH